MSEARPRLIDLDDLERYAGPPLYLFVGIDTGGSRVHDTFPAWASDLGLDARLLGLDLPTDTPAPTWERLVTTMRGNPAVHGAVVTSHKLRLYRAGRHVFDRVEPLVCVTHEVNSLDTRSGVRAFARDAQSLDVVLNRSDWHIAQGRPIACLGAGGSAIALLLATQISVPTTIAAGHVVVPRDPGTPELTIVGRRHDSLDEIQRVVSRAGVTLETVRLELAPSPQECADLIAKLPPDTLVVNATGLGKAAPGSPLPGPDAFPARGAAWDFNYRGPLTFLEQASAAGIPTEDGWDYFLAGWACALAAITDRDAAGALATFRHTSRR